jgi:hemerythrin-like metal-binding protein
VAYISVLQSGSFRNGAGIVQKSSVTRLILASLLALNLGFAVTVTVLLVHAWDSYALSGRGLALAQMDRQLFDAMVTIRARIAIEQTAVLSEDDPRPILDDARRKAAQAYDQALATLTASELPDALGLADAIRAAWARVDSRPIDAEALKPRAERSVADQEAWRQAVLGTAAAFFRASISASNAVRQIDTFSAEMVEIRRSAWTIRDSFGLQCSLLRPNVATGTPPDAKKAAAWQREIGAYVSAWKGLEQVLDRPGAPARLVEAMKTARDATTEAQKRIDAIAGKLDGSGKPAMPSAEWTQMCNAPFEPILALGFQALDEAVAHAAQVRSNARDGLLATGIGLAFALVLNGCILVVTVLRLARPIHAIGEAVSRLTRREYAAPVPPTGFSDELGAIASALESLRENAAEAETLRRAQDENRRMMEGLSEKLSKYLSPQICHSLLTGEKGTDLITQRKKLTIFFSDIKDFTKTTEHMQPEDLSYLLNSYFTEMSKIALQYGATIDKFIGDAMLMFFGDPETKGVRQDAEACVRMAVAMQRRMRKLQATWRFRGYKNPFHMRIGINTGFCNVGNFGSEERMDYTIIGAEVNLAARLESQADPDGILISEETYALVQDIIEAEERPLLQAKGIDRDIRPYAITDIYADELGHPDLIRSEFKGLRIVADLETIPAEDRAAIIGDVERLLGQLRALEEIPEGDDATLGPFHWAVDLDVGVKEIDDQHKVLVDMLNALSATIDTGRAQGSAPELTARMRAYAQEHFRFEEALMARTGYPDRNSHMLEHDAFIKNLLDQETELGAHGQEFAVEIREFVWQWLINHIAKTDKALGAYLCALEKTGQP